MLFDRILNCDRKLFVHHLYRSDIIIIEILFLTLFTVQSGVYIKRGKVCHQTRVGLDAWVDIFS